MARRVEGMTLVEIAVSLTILVGFLGVPAMLLLAASRSYATESSTAKVAEAVREGVEAVSSRLVQSSAGTVTAVAPVINPAVDDTLTYQRALDYQGGAIVWGTLEQIGFEYSPTDPDDGLDNDGDGLIDEGRVVWTEDPGGLNERKVTLAEWVSETMPGEIPGNGIDDNANGLTDEGGFSFEQAGDRVTIRLAITRPGPQGTTITRTLERTVAFLNPDP